VVNLNKVTDAMCPRVMVDITFIVLVKLSDAIFLLLYLVSKTLKSVKKKMREKKANTKLFSYK